MGMAVGKDEKGKGKRKKGVKDDLPPPDYLKQVTYPFQMSKIKCGA